MHKLSKYVWHAIGKSRRLAGKTYLVQKKLKTAFFCSKKSAPPHFGKIWRPNCWYQVNLWGSPENCGVYRFKLAIGKVGGIKIESAAGQRIFFANSLKTEIFRKSLHTQKFSTEIFFRQVLTESFCTQDSEYLWKGG